MMRPVALWYARLAMAALSLCLIGSGISHAAAVSSVTTLIADFSYPSFDGAMAVDGHGTIYISDYDKKRVLAVGPDSSQARVVASGLKDPESVAVDARGTVYIAEIGVGVLAVAPDGRRSTIGHGLDAAIALAIGPDGSLYAAVSLSGIIRIRPDGTQVVIVPHGVDSLTASLAVDSNGDAYLADGDSLRRISPQGQITAMPTTLAKPQLVATGPDDAVYVADKERYGDPKGSSLIVRIGRDGRRTRVGMAPNLPQGLAVDRQGNVYFFDGVSGNLLRVGPDGRTEAIGPLAGAPTALAIDRQGALYVADHAHFADQFGLVGARPLCTRILKIMPDGRQSVVLSGGLQDPSGLVLDGAGTFYILDRTNVTYRLLRLAPGGKTPQVVAGMTSIAGFSVDAAGVMYVALLDPHYFSVQLVKVYKDGRRQTTPLPQGVLSGNYTWGMNPLAVDGQGVLYIADNQQVLEIDPDGRQVIVPSPLPKRIKGLDVRITGLAVGDDGTLYLTGTSRGGDGQAVMLPHAGRPVTIATGLFEPGGIAVDTHGTVSIADTGNGRVVEVRQPPAEKTS